MAKKHEKAAKKKDKKSALKNQAVKIYKKSKSAEKVDEKTSEAAPPLPPPADAPPAADQPAYEVPSGKFRIISELAGSMLFGRQGSAIGASAEELQLLLEKDERNQGERLQ